MQSVFKGIYNTISNYQNEISSSVFQVTGALALNNTLTRVNLPTGYASLEGIYTVFDTTLGITWNGTYLPAGSALTNKLIIVPPSGFAIITEPYVDSTGKQVKVGLRQTQETEDSHTLTFDSVISSAGNTTREGSTITIYDVSTETQTRRLYYSASVLSAADFEDGVCTGSFQIVNGTGSFSKKFKLDYATESNELFKFSISNDSSFAKIVAATPIITVQDTSKPPTLSVSSTSLTEGVGFAVTASFSNSTELAPDYTYYYTIESITGNVNASDFADGVMSGSFKINPNTKVGTFTKQLKFDGSSEGTENFKIYLRPNSYTDASLADVTVAVSDSVKSEIGTLIPVNGATSSTGTTSPMPLELRLFTARVTEFVYTAAELTAAGLVANDVITGITFYLSSNWNTSYDYSNLIIGMQHTTNSSTLTAATVTGWTTVYSEVGPFVPNINAHSSLSTPRINFTNNFTWNGTNNLLIKIALSTNYYDDVFKGNNFYYAGSGQTYFTGSATPGATYGLGQNSFNTTTNRPKIGLVVAR